MSRMSKEFVVAELLAYYRKFDAEPVYQSRTRAVWAVNATEGPYSGSYAEAVRRIAEQQP